MSDTPEHTDRRGLELVKQAAADGNRQRWYLNLSFNVALFAAVVSLFSLVGVFGLFLQQRAETEARARGAEAGQQIISDLYSSVNDTNATVHRIEGTPAPPPLTPPTTASRPQTARSSTAPSVAPGAPRTTLRASTPSTTEIGQPAPQQPPATTTPPPASTTTTTICRVSVPVIDRCVGRKR